MRVFFLILFIIHGLIHLLGFVKAFNLTQIDQLTQHISKPVGLLWLFASTLFIATSILYVLEEDARYAGNMQMRM